MAYSALQISELGPRVARSSDRDMYQIILIIENGGNVTPTRCRATKTVLAMRIAR